VVVGVATGRGKSVRKELRERIDASLWGRMPIAYYNGAEAGLLDNDRLPGQDKTLSTPLDSLFELISREPSISQRCAIETNRHQLSVVPHHLDAVPEVWALVRSLIEFHGFKDVRALRSDHSVDILMIGVSKAAVFRAVRELARGRQDLAILCIGDRGCWPGNDCDLLCWPHSLSVDETSMEPAHCWNLASPGASHTAALVEYLGLLEYESGRAFFPARCFEG